MPIMRCTLPSGGKGYKYGESGKCYASKKQAIKQMRAIKSQQSKGDDIHILQKVSDQLISDEDNRESKI